MPKWSEIRALQFLEIYEKYECLWNPRIEDYKNKSSRNAAFEAMLAELKIPDLTPNDIKLKIKSIRTTYKRELSAVLKADANRTKGGPVYKPKLFWFNRADKFLRPVSTSRYSCAALLEEPKNESFVQYTSEETARYTASGREEALREKFKQEALHEMTIALNESDIEEQSNCDDDTKGMIVEEDHSVQHEEHEIEESVSEQQHNQSTPMIETIREETITVTPYRPNESYEHGTATIQEVEAVSTMARSSHDDDEYKLFCKSVEAQLRSIPDAYSRSVAKFKIQQVLFEAETGHYRKTAYVTIPSTHP